MRRLAIVPFLALAAFGHAQSVADALRAPARTLTASDLPDGLRAVALGSGNDSIMSLGMYMGRAFSGGEGGSEDQQTSLILSLMGSTFVDPDQFAELLEGKRPRIRGYAIDLNSMMANSKGAAGAPSPVFAEQWIEAGRVVQWSPRPTLTKEALLTAFGKPNVPGDSAAGRTQALSNVKQLSLGFIMYAGDADDVLPKADSTAAVKKTVLPYLKNDLLWTGPNGGRILYNTALSGISMTAIEDPSQTLLVWEEKPNTDGSRAVGYVDGHAKRVTAAEWDTLWKSELARRVAFRKAKSKISPF